jgi:hypothetical protein
MARTFRLESTRYLFGPKRVEEFFFFLASIASASISAFVVLYERGSHQLEVSKKGHHL